jgi:hypothetical protein
MKKIFTVIILISLTQFNMLNGQGLGETFGPDPNDNEAGIEYLVEYLRPAIVSASNGVPNGWNNTAKPHKLFGFDATLTVSYAGVPQVENTFLFENSKYEEYGENYSIRLANQNEAELPTIFGGEPPAGTELEVFNKNSTAIPSPPFSPPSGTGIGEMADFLKPGIPIVLANIGVGLPKNTELRVRFSPINNIGEDISIAGSFGIGVLHDIKQWIPGIKLAPLDIAAFVGYNRYNFSYSDENQNEVNFSSSATTVNILASKKLLFFTPYIGLGFNAINSSFSFSSPDAGIENAEFEYADLGGARATIGARLKILWVLAINVDYTIQKYNTLNVGLGLNIR